MKKIFPAALLLVILYSLSIVSCHQGLSGEAYTLKMRLSKNDSFHQAIKMNMLMNMKVMGQAMDMKMNMDAGMDFHVLDTSSTKKDLQLTYTNFQMSMDMGKSIPKTIDTDSIMNQATKNMIGKSFMMELAPNNEIIAVTGFDSLMAGSAGDEASRKMMEKMFSKDQVNNMFGMMFSMYPNKPVRVGETWTSKNKVNISNIDMQINITFKLVGVKNGLADIDMDGVIDGKGKMNQGPIALDMTMSGTQKGMMTIKMADGYLQNGSYKTDMKAEMEMMGQKVPMTMKMDYFLNNK
ncbi:DUF6263 family protein [Ferruginibacter sp.]